MLGIAVAVNELIIIERASDHGPRTRATSERGESFCYAEVGTNYPGVKFMQVHRGDESRCVILSRVLFIAEIGSSSFYRTADLFS